DRIECLVRAGGKALAFRRSPPPWLEVVRMYGYAGFRARPRRELPKGLSTNLSHQLSTVRAAVSARLTGAIGTVISWSACSSFERPRRRWAARPTAMAGKRTALVYVRRSIENPAPVNKRSSEARSYRRTSRLNTE